MNIRGIKGMNIIIRNISNVPVILLSMVIILLSSCIKDDRDNCGGVNVNFNYSYNILSSNAFGEQADKVVLYVFGEDGLLVKKITKEGAAVTNDLTISLAGLRDGKYQFAAWAQSTNVEGEQANFEIPDLAPGQSTIDELTAFLKRTNGIQGHELNHFMIGCVTSEIASDAGYRTVTVDLKKVTNKIRVILLPGTTGGTLDKDDYQISINDEIGNGHINYDYSLLGDGPLTYSAYFKANMQPGEKETLAGNGPVDNAVVAELNTSRLMEANKPGLVITNSTNGNEIVNLNLCYYISLIRLESHAAEWSLQEYLDRQDEYAISIYVDTVNRSWLKSVLIINGWVINLAEIDF